MVIKKANFCISLDVMTLSDLKLPEFIYDGYDCDIHIKKSIDYSRLNYNIFNSFNKLSIYLEKHDKDNINEIIFCRKMIERGVRVYYKQGEIWIKIEMPLRYRKLIDSIIIKMDESVITIDTPTSVSLFYKLLNGVKYTCLEEQEKENAKLFEKVGFVKIIGDNLLIPAIRARKNKLSDWE